MNPWFESFFVSLLALAGVFIGLAFSRSRKPYWLLGYFASLLLIAVLSIATYSGRLAFAVPFSWLMVGRIKFAILGLAATIGLTTPLSRLRHKLEKVTVCILMGIVVFYFSIFPFLVPGLIKGRLSSLKTHISALGVCYQSTNYTCGPAAAVTALKKLGIAADEGEIAILAHTSPVTGTMPWCLSAALEKRYGAEGLKCRYRYFESLDQLRGAGLTLAVIKNQMLSDHCVAVMEVSDRMVTFADPVMGMVSMTHENFEKIWRFRGISLHRMDPSNVPPQEEAI
jgi:predicted double-glycine peptidase